MIDTHTHIDGKEFDDDRSEVIARAVSEGVKAIFLPNIDVCSLDALHSACSQYPDVCYPMYGLHPEEVCDDFRSQLDIILQHADNDPRIIGVGEIGLDLYWEQDKADLQAQAFSMQIEYAIRRHLPMSIHIRNAFPLMYDVFSHFDATQLVGSLHCFSGTREDAVRINEQYPNLMFGVNGTFTYKKSQLPDIFAEVIPVDKVLLETDAPYLSPVPLRGKRNEPSHLKHVLSRLAEAYHIDAADMERITEDNTHRLFHLYK